MVDILHYMNLDVALQIEAMISDWIDLYFPGPGSLLTTVVDLIQSISIKMCIFYIYGPAFKFKCLAECGGAIGRDLWQLLFEFVGDSGDKRDSSIKQITSGCRSIMDTLLADLLEIVHQVLDISFFVVNLKTFSTNLNVFDESFLVKTGRGYFSYR